MLRGAMTLPGVTIMLTPCTDNAHPAAPRFARPGEAA